MLVKNLIQQVSTDAELTALTGMVKNHFVYHNGLDKLYTYEPKYGTGDISSIDGGFWVEDDIEVLDLQGYKDYRKTEIDFKTNELISQGCTFDNETFSMSEYAQINWSNFLNVPDSSFPYPVTTIDDKKYFCSLDNKYNFYYTILEFKGNHIKGGGDLKELIDACTTVQEVQNIIDLR